MRRITTISIALPLLLLSTIFSAACGGGGTTTGESTGGGTSISLKSSKSLIRPGEAVSLTWQSQNANDVLASNLGVHTVNGTVTVSPTFTSTYTITVSGEEDKTATVKVVVDRPSAKFIVVGNPSDPEVPQIQGTLQQVGSVIVQQTLPSVSSFDAVIIHSSANMGPSDASTVTGYLAANKGVVLLGLAPSKLATGEESFGDKDVLDTSTISSWFGGVGELEHGVGGGFSIPYGLSFNLNYYALPFSQGAYTSGDGDDSHLPRIESGRIGVNAYQVLKSTGFFSDSSTISFAYKVPTGGRVFWQWHSGGFDAENLEAMAKLFRTGSLWAACP